MNSLGLLVILFAVSFFKDDVTPDYLNTDAAYFLKEAPSRISTVISNPWFWLKSFVYSSLFVYLPYVILSRSTSLAFAKMIAILFIAIAIGLYMMIWIQVPRLDISVIPKINRFFHSPIFTLFFLASFTINKRMQS